MPRGWPFTVRSPAWRGRWARTEPDGLVREAACAFVDRTSIEWSVLLRRLRSRGDQRLIRNLRTIALIRERSRQSTAAPDLHGPITIAVWTLIVLALAHVAAASIVAAAAALQGRAVGQSGLQLLLAFAYAFPVLVLPVQRSSDARRVFLIASFVCCGSAFARGAFASLNAASPIVESVLRGVAPEVFAPACLWEFALRFPRVSRFTRFDRGARRVTSVMWIAALGVYAAIMAAALFGVDEHTFAAILPNRASNLYWRAFTIAEVLGVAAIAVRARRAPIAERQRVARLAYALAFCALPFLAMGLVRTLAPSVDLWLQVAPAEERWWVDAAVLSGLMLMPVLACAAIIVDRPFELQRRIAHGGRNAGAAPHERLGSALQQLRVARGRRDVADILARAAADLLGASAARVLVPTGAGDFADVRGHTRLPADGAIAALMRATTRPLHLGAATRVFSLLPRDDRQWLVENRVEIAAPIVRRDSSIAAIVVADRAPADERQRGWRLGALVSAAATAWDANDAEREARAYAGPAALDRAYECPGCGLVCAALPLDCSCNQPAVLAALPHRLVSRFIVERRIGSGAMGVVYVGRDLRLERRIALKTLPRLDREALARLREEARSMAAFAHEGVATLYDFEVWRDTPILVMEYFPHGTLAAALGRERSLPLDRALRIGYRLARAVGYLHDRGFTHRDVKPSNIALAHDEAPKLLDFGLATITDRAAHAPGRTAGTLAYLPPESLRGAPLSVASDLWAIALVVAESVLGENPAASKSPASPGELVATIAQRAPALSAIAERAFARDPQARFQTASELADAIDDELRRRGLQSN
jgi:hypothetical protein